MGEELGLALPAPPSLEQAHLADLCLCSFSRGQLLIPTGFLQELSVSHPEMLSSRNSFLPALKPIADFGD